MIRDLVALQCAKIMAHFASSPACTVKLNPVSVQLPVGSESTFIIEMFPIQAADTGSVKFAVGFFYRIDFH